MKVVADAAKISSGGSEGRRFWSWSRLIHLGVRMTPETVSASVATAVLGKFASLPKSGKPTGGEYTLLAGFAITDDTAPDLPPRVVALGTGTKCLPATSRCVKGESLADSHAEVLARRALIHFLYDEFDRVLGGDDGGSDVGSVRGKQSGPPPPIVTWAGPKQSEAEESNAKDASAKTHPPFALKPGIKLHLYVTQSPCGDASIFYLQSSSKKKENKDSATVRTGDESDDDPGLGKKSKRAKTGGVSGARAGATGAKRIMSQPGDIVGDLGDTKRTGDSATGTADTNNDTPVVDPEHRVARQAVGACRTKPGRGAPTNCMSCSDKICRWLFCGVQGGLVSMLLRDPLRIDTITVALPEAATSESGGFAFGGGGTGSSNDRVPSSGRENDETTVFQALQRALGRGVLGRPHSELEPRASCDEGNRPYDPVPKLFLSPPPPPYLSSTSGQQRGWVSSPTSINWVYRWHPDGAVKTEVTLGASGKKNGFSKAKKDSSPAAVSRVSRKSLGKRFLKLATEVGLPGWVNLLPVNAQSRKNVTAHDLIDTGSTDHPAGNAYVVPSYFSLKNAATAYSAKSRAFTKKETFAAWSVKTNGGDFPVSDY